MHIQLAVTLFSKNLFNKDMEIIGVYDTPTLGSINTIKTTGSFLIKKVDYNANNALVFHTVSSEDGHVRCFEPENVIAIDGMTPARFAAVYGIAPDGGLKRQGKRRGRKVKTKDPSI